MDNIARFRKSWFYIACWLVLLLISYGWQTLGPGGTKASLLLILLDAGVFLGFLLLWISFFSQFVLPVRTIPDRLKIVHYLLKYLSGRHGPVLFIEDGRIVEHMGERRRKGPGVVWLDSASAAVTRTSTRIKQTIGPGVHFLEQGEFLAGVIDLHIQTQVLGLKESDKPFEEQREDQVDEEYNQIQYRRKMVNALTRDRKSVV